MTVQWNLAAAISEFVDAGVGATRARQGVGGDSGNADRMREIKPLPLLSGQHTMAAIANHFDVHYTTVSRLVKAYEAAQRRGM